MKKAKSRKYRGIFDGLSVDKSRQVWKRIGLNNSNLSKSKKSKWDGTRYPEEWTSSVGVINPSQIIFGNLS